MKTIKISHNKPDEDLKILANQWSGELKEKLGFSSVLIDNSWGRGTVSAYKISERFSAFKFDFVLNQEVDLLIEPTNHTIIDFIYCLEGSVKHSISDKKGFKAIGFRQNALVKRCKGKKGIIKIAPDVHLKMSFLTIDLSSTESSSAEKLSVFRRRTNDLKEALNIRKNNRHLGRVCFRTADYAKTMIEKSVESVSDVIFVEAAILNILASQIGRYQADVNGLHTNAPIRPSEIDKIRSIHAFITDNLSENLPLDRLASLSGLSTTKLQIGFKYLYNTNVASYITQKRVELAASLMENGDMNISEIVYAIGFSSRSYFSKIFKRRFGVRPSDYTKRKIKTEMV